MDNQISVGPRRHGDMSGVALAYVNYLEDRVFTLENGPFSFSDQRLADVRAKNTELEIKYREQKEFHNKIVEGQAETLEELREDMAELIAARDEARTEARALHEQNATLNAQLNDLRNLRDANYHDGMKTYTRECGAWVKQTFNDAVLHDYAERARRMLEEAAETGQVLAVPRYLAHRIIDHVYDKPAGKIDQELGGVIVTWAALVDALGFNPNAIMNEALDDCYVRQQIIKDKWADKIAKGISADAGVAVRVPVYDPRTGQSIVRNIPEEAYKVRVEAPYSDAPQSHDQRGAQIIEEGRKKLDAHIAATKPI